MRIATSSIPRQQLSKILYQALDPKDADQRLRVVRLYLQSERYNDARDELNPAVDRNDAAGGSFLCRHLWAASVSWACVA